MDGGEAKVNSLLKEKWPKSIRINGFILLNGEKMSKNAGNFVTARGYLSSFSNRSPLF